MPLMQRMSQYCASSTETGVVCDATLERTMFAEHIVFAEHANAGRIGEKKRSTGCASQISVVRSGISVTEGVWGNRYGVVLSGWMDGGQHTLTGKQI